MISFAARARAAMFFGVLTLVLLSGCATTNNPRDPLEPINRVVYHINDGVDNLLLKPLATVYRGVIPQFARTGITNFFGNFNDILTALNNLLQGKLGTALSDAGRVAVNSTVGLLGLIDVGTELGLEKHNEDFGQTLGYWGLGPGPYLQLPLFGPSSARDAVGRFVDARLDPVRWIWRHDTSTRNSLWGLNLVNTRANLLDSTKILEEAALDAYEFQRDAFLQRRRNLVYDGNPPAAPEEDFDVQRKPATQPPAKPRSEVDDPARPVIAGPTAAEEAVSMPDEPSTPHEIVAILIE